MNTQLHERIRHVRQRLKLTQDDVAQHLEITKSAVGAWEDPKKTNSPSSANLRRLASLLGVSLEWLGSDESRLEDLEDHPTESSKKGVQLSAEEAELLSYYRCCPAELRPALLASAKAISHSQR